MGSRGKAQGPLIPPSLGQHAESQLPGLVLERDRDVERGEQVVEEPFVVLLATAGPVLASRLAPPAAVSSRALIGYWPLPAKKFSGLGQVTCGIPAKSLQISPRRLCTVGSYLGPEDALSGSWRCGIKPARVPAGAGRRCGPWVS